MFQPSPMYGAGDAAAGPLIRRPGVTAAPGPTTVSVTVKKAVPAYNTNVTNVTSVASVGVATGGAPIGWRDDESFRHSDSSFFPPSVLFPPFFLNVSF